MPGAYMYILICRDGSYFTSSTEDLKARFKQEQLGEGATYTRRRLPLELVYWEHFDTLPQAFTRQVQVESWTRRKKQALIAGEITELEILEGCRNAWSSTSRDDEDGLKSPIAF